MPTRAGTLAAFRAAVVEGSLLYQLGHAVRMAGRTIANRATSCVRIRGRGNEIRTSAAVLRRCSIDIIGDDNIIEIMPNACLLGTRIRMRGSRHRLWIGADACAHGGGFSFDYGGCSVRVGAKSTFFGVEIGATEGSSIEIGEDCLFSSAVEIRNGDSHSLLDARSARRLNQAKDVSIGDHVWLGTRVLVLKGSRIGSGSTVGAASVVTGEVPDNSLAVGSP